MIEDDPAEHLAGQCLDGRFELEALVGRGGHGLVYRGVHRALRCPIAVKLLSIHSDMDFVRGRLVEQFENEARTVAALRHPAIVRVLDHGVAQYGDASLPYLVLEWVDGETLEAALRSMKPQSPREALSLLRPVFEAIGTAHAAGVIHRDIKPSNIMVSRGADGERALHVLDFGISKLMRPDEVVAAANTKTTDDLSSFSLSHAAPEQVARMRTGPWTDVHSLALLLVEILVGERAYRAENNVELLAKITASERPTPKLFGRRVGRWEQTLRRALSVHVHDRPTDALALLRALEEGLDDAQRAWESREPETRGPSRAKPRALASAGLVISALLGGALLWRARPTNTASAAGHAAPRTAQAQPADAPVVAGRARSVEPARVAVVPTQPATTASEPATPQRRPGQRRNGPRAGARTQDHPRSLIDDEVVVQ